MRLQPDFSLGVSLGHVRLRQDSDGSRELLKGALTFFRSASLTSDHLLLASNKNAYSAWWECRNDKNSSNIGQAITGER
jgi:hypothetical protein